jgi:acetolactate synthase-1/2/3 large subunit
MKASDYIASVLARKQVPAVFELVGGMITHMLDSLHVRNEVRIVSMHHEQAAAFAAEAAGRITGIPGVAMATSGPGATNLLTGVASCFFDSSPAVFITGQVNRNEQKGDRAIRQLGFQETDIVSMARPIVKKAWKINAAQELPSVMEEAFVLASSGRPGPVLIDIPMDVQRDDVTPDSHGDAHVSHSPPLDERDFIAIRDALLHARKPMILAGGGIRSARATAEFRTLVRTAGVPVVHSLMGADLLPYGDPLNVGMIGSYGNRWANLALTQSDCVIVLGSRLDVRQTGADTVGFKGDRTIFHIDCEPGEMNNRVKGCQTVLSEIKPAMIALTETLRSISQAVIANQDSWLGEISQLRQCWPDTDELAGVEGINPNVFMHQLSRASRAAAAYVVDVGQHQMWAAQSLELNHDQRFITSGGLGSMGFGLPAAVGAAVALKGQPLVVIAGDGGFQCNIQELQTVARLGLPAKIVVINNQCHGMVRQFQESYFDARYQSTMWGYSAPDFARISDAYGIPSRTVSEPNGVADAVSWLTADLTAPSLLQVMISPKANAYPKLAFGKGMSSMEPHEKPLEMEGT